THQIQNLDTPEYTDKTVIELKNQIDFLKKQLEKAADRETKANARIDTLLTLIEMKPLKSNIDLNKENIESKISPNSDDITTNIPSNHLKEDGLTSSENKRIPVPEHVEPEPKKRSFLSRFFLPYG